MSLKPAGMERQRAQLASVVRGRAMVSFQASAP